MKRTSSIVFLMGLLASCSPPPTGNDAGDSGDATGNEAATDATSDSGFACGDETVYIHSIHPGAMYVRTGATFEGMVRIGLDRACAVTLDVSVADTAIATVTPTARIDVGQSTATFTITGVSAGRTKLRVRTPGLSTPESQMEIDLVVMDAAVSACPAGTMINGNLSPGAEIKGMANTPLAAARVALPSALVFRPTSGTIACANGLTLPTNYTALGPAITFGPEYQKFAREVQVEIPVNPALVPSMKEMHVEVLYSGPGVSPRIVPFTNVRFTTSGTAIGFTTARLGTFQAVIRSDLGTRRVRRHYVYRALLGVSMGAIGTSMVGPNNIDKFDVLAPLGGPLEWGWFGDYIRSYALGGFCTEAQRATLGSMCDRASYDRLPPLTDSWVPLQHFEYFNSSDGAEGQGGSFARDAYIRIFKDLGSAFGNALIDTDPANHYYPLGIPASDGQRPSADRCANPVVLSNYCDDEYNPTGDYPVITFCDGNHTQAHEGEWEGPPGRDPVEVTLAVDRNRNGVRDFGEPVIRNFSEPFDDFGADGVASASEAGYNAVTNPDPAGDDYDRLFNPAGTEGNRVYNMGEPFRDFGLDGVRRQGRCQADTGEGNNQFDLSYGAQQVLARNGRRVYAEVLTAKQAHDTAIWADGGSRDLLGLGASAHHWMSAVVQRNESLHVYNNFTPLLSYRPFSTTSDVGYDYKLPDYANLPDHVMLRYGFDDATPAQLAAGDGGHVGETLQALNRIYTAMFWSASRWPGGNRDVGRTDASRDDAGRCSRGVLCSFDFTGSVSMRTGPVSIALPPGYHDPGNTTRYPVMYVLHGYGMDATSLLAVGPLIGQSMISTRMPRWQRPQKFILVFVDGRCRGTDGCVTGTFYSNSPTPGRVQSEQFLMDLYNYVDANFRVKAAEDIEVTE